MSASSIEIKGIAKSDCSSSSSKKNESVYSAASLNSKTRMLQRKTQTRQAGFITNGPASGLNSEIRQRVLSARQHRYRGLQNQLNMALQQNAELINENRLLKTLQKRQDNALIKYESSTSELPQLIKSHTEELRVWQTKYRALSLQNRELTKKLQQKDKIMLQNNDRMKYLTNLTSERNLEERETLQIKVESLEQKLNEKEEEIKMLSRRNTIEAKNFKMQLANERKKYKELCQKQNGDKQNGSSVDSDYSSAKDVKDAKHINGLLLSASSAISEETPPLDLNVDIDDDDDLVIKQLIDKDTCIIRNDDSDRQIARQLADINFFANEGAQSIHAIHQKIQNDIEKNEAILDLHCDEISHDITFNLPKDSSLFDVERSSEIGTLKPINNLLLYKGDKPNGIQVPLPINAKPRMNSCLPRFNINLAGKPLKRTPIDPQKKSRLLAQLKSIESGNGCL
ncbi:uncharacterized protein LOC129578224 isoform X2 [Sitodiplosis mosellana]|uniref:uncharacterized protein LOC129578224 isoform X2 n=1 Tax=Sitodiplosis mosellana TaxID=263140 RepID=UPI0024452775|nr:uncharacterized protein LOC129578224 isoform X2 [Sitodiplosis mosellana]